MASDVTHVGARERGVGFVFQNYALFRHMTVAENIEFALRVRRMKAADRRARREGAAAAGRAGRHGRAPARAALRRPAAARGRGARAGAQAAGAAARRTLRRARRQDPRGTAPHHPRGAARAGHHHGAGHARPGRSLRAGRPHRRHEPRAACSKWARPQRTVRAAGHALRRHLPRRRQPAAGAAGTRTRIRFGSTPVDAAARNPVPPGREHEVVTVLRPEEVEIAATRESLRLQLHCTRHGRGDAVHRRARTPAPAAARRPGRRAAWLGSADATRASRPRARSPSSARCRCRWATRWCWARAACTCCPRRCRASSPARPPKSKPARMRRAVPLLDDAGHAHEDARGRAPARRYRRAARAGRRRRGDRRRRRAQARCAAQPAARVAPTRCWCCRPTPRCHEQICIHWLDDAVRHATLAVAASLLRHLPAEAVCYAIAPDARREPARRCAARAARCALGSPAPRMDSRCAPSCCRATGPAACGATSPACERRMLVLGVDTAPQDIYRGCSRALVMTVPLPCPCCVVLPRYGDA